MYSSKSWTVVEFGCVCGATNGLWLDCGIGSLESYTHFVAVWDVCYDYTLPGDM